MKPTTEMTKFYKERTNRHIKNVLKWTSRINSNMGTTYNFNNHDASKLQSPEKIPYTFLTWYYKEKNEGREYVYPPGVEEKVSKAIQHHYDVNPHHPEFHCEPGTKPADGSEMKMVDIVEMCADHMSMSEEMGGHPLEFFKKKLGSDWIFTESQLDCIYEIFELYDKYVK